MRFDCARLVMSSSERVPNSGNRSVMVGKTTFGKSGKVRTLRTSLGSNAPLLHPEEACKKKGSKYGIDSEKRDKRL